MSAAVQASSRMATLGDLVDRVETLDPSRLPPGTTFRYIDIAAVDRVTKTVTAPDEISVEAALSRARQVVRSGDILVSTVRPNLNTVALLGSSHDGAIASTGFCVLRPRQGLADSSYVFHWVRSRQFIEAMTRQATGASYPAVSDCIIMSSRIPMPSILEQRRIAAILDKADALRRKRQQALQLADEFRCSIFLDVFADPAARCWPERRIADLATDIRTGPFGSQLLHSEFVSSGIAVLGIDNAVQNKFAWSRLRYITKEKFERLQRYQVKPGDVIITLMGTCGRCAVVPSNIPTAINTKHLCCITLDTSQCLPGYLHACFLLHARVRHQLGIGERGAIMPGLNMQTIKELKIPIPPVERQRAFISRVSAVDHLKESAQSSLAQTDYLFSVIQQRAFNHTRFGCE